MAKGRKKGRNSQVAARGASTAANGQPAPSDRAEPASTPCSAAAPSSEEGTDYLDKEDYRRDRALILELKKANTDQHDKAILQLTAGILALTITFISNIAPNPPHETMIWLVSGWACLAASMTAILISFQTGQWACDIQVAMLDKHAETAKKQDRVNWLSKATIAFNISALFLFIAGIILVAVFSGLNLLVPRTTSPPTTQGAPVAETPRPSPTPAPIQPSPPSAPAPKPETGHAPSSPPVVPVAPTPQPGKKK